MLIKWRMFCVECVANVRRDAMTSKSEHKTFISHKHHYSLKPVNFLKTNEPATSVAVAPKPTATATITATSTITTTTATTRQEAAKHEYNV